MTDIKQQETFKFKDCISKISASDVNNPILNQILSHLNPTEFKRG